MKKQLAVLLLGGLSVTAYADQCDSTKNVYDDIYCSNKIFAKADADLNKNYKTLRALLTKTQRTTLLKSQKTWIDRRNSSCSNDDSRTVYVNCNLRMTEERNHWLTDRIRECQTVGCKSSRLKD